jgi:hypothetical protein
VSVGNAELGNEMASYTTNQKMFVVKPFTLLVVLMLMSSELYLQEFCVRAVQSRDAIYRTVEQIEGTGRACYKRARARKRRASIRMEKNGRQ